MREWEECDISGNLISDDYCIWEEGTGVWYLDEKQDYMGFVPIGQFKSLEEAKEAADA